MDFPVKKTDPKQGLLELPVTKRGLGYQEEFFDLNGDMSVDKRF